MFVLENRFVACRQCGRKNMHTHIHIVPIQCYFQIEFWHPGCGLQFDLMIETLIWRVCASWKIIHINEVLCVCSVFPCVIVSYEKKSTTKTRDEQEFGWNIEWLSHIKFSFFLACYLTFSRCLTFFLSSFDDFIRWKPEFTLKYEVVKKFIPKMTVTTEKSYKHSYENKHPLTNIHVYILTNRHIHKHLVTQNNVIRQPARQPVRHLYIFKNVDWVQNSFLRTSASLVTAFFSIWKKKKKRD